MKNQSVIVLVALGFLSAPILAGSSAEKHLKKKFEDQPFVEEYSHYDETQQAMETPEWAPSGTESAGALPQEIPEEIEEANQSGADLEEPLSKITK